MKTITVRAAVARAKDGGWIVFGCDSYSNAQVEAVARQQLLFAQLQEPIDFTHFTAEIRAEVEK